MTGQETRFASKRKKYRKEQSEICIMIPLKLTRLALNVRAAWLNERSKIDELV
jgi:hypothetical protein